MHASPSAAIGSSITAIAACNTCRSNTPSAWPRSASNPRLAASATAQPVLGPAQPDPGDNALAETINGLYKTEVIHRRGPWRRIEDIELATLEWVDWFNHRRLLEPIGNMPPAEAEKHYYAQIQTTALAA